MSDNGNCLICGRPGAIRKSITDENGKDRILNTVDDEIYCKDCGQVYLHQPLYRQLKIERENPDGYPNTLFKMACLLYERKLQGKIAPIAFYMKDHGKPDLSCPCYEYEDWTKSFPVDPLTKIDRALLNIKNVMDEDFTQVIEIFRGIPLSPTPITEDRSLWHHDNEHLTKILFCKDFRSANELASLMVDMNYVTQSPTLLGNGKRSGTSAMHREGFSLRITANGWYRISVLQDQQTENSETCFLAMAFNENLDQYREAVREAVRQAGYRANEIRVDEVDHNDFIMDKVINLINESRFVIADFTAMPEIDKEKEKPKTMNGVRGSVYWEAGYARGLGKEVIHTHRDDKDTLRRVHFDIEQISRLPWNENELDKFIKKLTEHIKSTVSKGPLPID